MNFTLFMPPHVDGPVPYVVYLSGLTCTEENFTIKAGAYEHAAALGLAVLAPDTSPRGPDVPDGDGYDLGQGAGFYIDATQEPWAKYYRMESYIMKELLPGAEQAFGLDPSRKSIMGHSMGGHGALTFNFKYPGVFKACSAFAPVVAASQSPLGQQALRTYLGDDQGEWMKHDACALVARCANDQEILIDQGGADEFLESSLKPHLFEEACHKAGQKLTLRMQDGYDHSYFFIQSFIDDHLKWHAQRL